MGRGYLNWSFFHACLWKCEERFDILKKKVSVYLFLVLFLSFMLPVLLIFSKEGSCIFSVSFSCLYILKTLGSNILS